MPLLTSRIQGTGDPVLLLHGLFGAGDNLGRLAKHLAGHFEVHLLDNRNHGASFHSKDMTYELMAQDVMNYIEHHQLGFVSLFGHSMGGKISMQTALLWPNQIKRLIVGDIAPVDYPPHHNEIFAGLDAVTGSRLSSRSEADEILSRYVPEQSVRQFLLKNLKRSALGDYEWKMNLASIKANYNNILSGLSSTTPFEGDTLFIGGALSNYILPEHKTATQALFPNASVKFIPNTSHWLHAEKPDLFNAICLKFLKE